MSNHFRDPPADFAKEALVEFKDRLYVPTAARPQDVPNPGREVLVVAEDGAWLVAVGLAAFGTLPGDLILSRGAIHELVSQGDHDLIPVHPEDEIQ